MKTQQLSTLPARKGGSRYAEQLGGLKGDQGGGADRGRDAALPGAAQKAGQGAARAMSDSQRRGRRLPRQCGQERLSVLLVPGQRQRARSRGRHGEVQRTRRGAEAAGMVWRHGGAVNNNWL